MKKATEATAAIEVRFPKGRYYLDADIETDEYAKATNDALAMARAENVILNGNGSELIIRTAPTGFLAMYACKNVIVRDFVVDWDPPLRGLQLKRRDDSQRSRLARRLRNRQRRHPEQPTGRFRRRATNGRRHAAHADSHLQLDTRVGAGEPDRGWTGACPRSH